MGSLGSFIAIALVGIVLFALGVTLNKKTRTKKTLDDRRTEYFASYDKRMDEFRKP
jgi:hypothetical protein